MRILLDIDGTFASWDTVEEHGFGPKSRPYDPRVHDLIAHHDITLFSRNPEIIQWAALLGCTWMKKPAPGEPSLNLKGYDLLLDDEAPVFAYHQPGIRQCVSLDGFFEYAPPA
ncbi:MAG: hypothetical protein ABI743_11605 [bacterium]